MSLKFRHVTHPSTSATSTLLLYPLGQTRLLPAPGLNISIGHKRRSAGRSNIDVMPRYTGLLSQTADPNDYDQGGEVGVSQVCSIGLVRGLACPTTENWSSRDTCTRHSSIYYTSHVDTRLVINVRNVSHQRRRGVMLSWVHWFFFFFNFRSTFTRYKLSWCWAPHSPWWWFQTQKVPLLKMFGSDAQGLNAPATWSWLKQTVRHNVQKAKVPRGAPSPDSGVHISHDTKCRNSFPDPIQIDSML